MDVPAEKEFKKGTYLIDKYGYGCTMVFNNVLKNLAISHIPKHTISHDNWVGLLGVFLGKYYFDKRPYIYYRQHQSNIVGGKNDIVARWKRRFRALKDYKKYSREIIAKELLSGYCDLLSEEDRKLILVVANYKDGWKNKLKLFFNKEIKRSTFEKNFIFRILILFALV